MAQKLNDGFIVVEDAIALISKHTKTEPTVDLAFLVDNIGFLEEKHNFTIKRIELKDGKANHLPSVYVAIDTVLEREQLKKAIVDKASELIGKKLDLDEMGLRRMSTTIDDTTNANAAVMPNDKSEIKLGDTITTGRSVVNV